MAEDEAAAYDFSIELQRRKQRQRRNLCPGARSCLASQGIIDLIGINGYYSFLAMMMNVARTKPDTGKAGCRCKRFPD